MRCSADCAPDVKTRLAWRLQRNIAVMICSDLDTVKSFLGQTVTVTIDRPLGSRHPLHGFFYPVNYGYVPGTLAADGEPVDAYVLGVFEPLSHFTGTCIALIQRLDDDDDKLVVVPPGRTYTADQIQALTEFQERFFTCEILWPVR